ncbi:MAG: hypothetical protein KDA85_12340, partial [Planctomycetaceae bacterium]|nr:hypothetical protein [Planctomycetaceae bacterium]
SGVQMENAGQVTLQRMILDDNETGITVLNSGLAVDDDQFLRLYSSQVDRSDVRGIHSINLIELDIQDTSFNTNGDDAALGRETILAQYSELLNDPTTEQFDEFDNPYLINIDRSTFISTADDAVVIETLTGGSNSHLGLDMTDNNFTVSDLTDPDPADLQDDAIIVNWNGPALARFQSNSFLLDGATAQTAIDFQALSTTDHLGMTIQGNQVNSTVTNTLALTQNRGFRVRTLSQSDILINANTLSFTGGEGLGMEFNLAANTTMQILNNTISDLTDGGAGMIFNTVSQPSLFVISGNTITLFDTGVANEEGILFRSVGGLVNLAGTQDNVIVVGNPQSLNARIETIFSMPAGSNIGTILVNGVPTP